MKIAICLYGLVGSRTNKNGFGEPLDPKIAYDLIKHNLIDANNGHEIDIFIHSWSYEKKEKLVELYKPVDFIIEKQREFSGKDKLSGNIGFKQKISEYAKGLVVKDRLNIIKSERKKEAFRAFSRWYSSKKTIELKRAHELKLGIVYDAVIVSRLDVGFYTPLCFEEYNLNKFYASHWNDYPCRSNGFKLNKKNHYTNRGFLDFWFFSNSMNMDKFSELYDNIDSYHVTPHISSYQHVKKLGLDIAYTKYRWIDHEMIRRKEFMAEK